MSNFFAEYPVNGVPVFANSAAFPPGGYVGELAVAADTGNLFEWNGTTWQQISGPGSALTLGALDSQPPTAAGAALVAGVLSMQSADATHPGLVNNTSQTFSGQKTFSSDVLIPDGTVSLPGLAFSSETSTGIYKIGSGELGVSALGVRGIDVLNIGGGEVNLGFGSGTAASASGSSTVPVVFDRTLNAQVDFQYGNSSMGTASVTDFLIYNGTGANYLTFENWANNTINTYLGGGSVVASSPFQTQFVIASEGPGTFIGFDVGGRTLATERMRLTSTLLALNAGVSQSYSGSSSGTITVQTQAASGTFNFNLPITAGTTGQVLTSQAGGSTAMTWTTPTVGTVTSVGFSVPAASLFAATGSPVTTSGTLGLTTTGTSGGIPYFSSTSQLNSSALLTASQLIIGGGAGTAPLTLAAGSQFQSLVMGATVPGYSAVPLNQSAAVSGALAIANGGTGQTTANAAFNALSPMTTLGDLIYEDVTPKAVRLAGNTTATKNFLVQTGNGSVSAAPSWGTIASGDLPTVTLTGDVTGASSGGSIATTLATVNSNVGTFASVTVNGKGLVTAAAALSGDLTTSGAVTTLATVNSNVGSFTNANITVNAKGLITAAANGTATSTAPTQQKFLTTGSTTGYLFTISTSTTCAVGDTYTNNSNTYTVLGALSAQSGSVLYMSNAAAPLSSGTLTRATGAGTSSITFSAAAPLATYTKPTSPAPLYIRIRMVGGGGGGGGSGTAVGSSSGGGGSDSMFGANILVAHTGNGASSSAQVGPTGGTASLGTGPIGLAIQGAYGGIGAFSTVVSGFPIGGSGGSTPFGGNGAGGINAGGTAGIANTGSGGGGAGGSASAMTFAGPGGAASGYIDAIINSSIAASYPYLVGVGGSGGSAGTNGNGGAAGGSGIIIVDEYYQ